ncbi:MAG TPA: C25 family cysteine peptidase, partial [Vicinamibacteria bacterium]
MVEKNSRHVVLELTTPGFTAEPEPDGSVRISIPGFTDGAEPGSPAIPVLRSWVELESGVGARIGSVRPENVQVFSLRPTAAEAPELVATPEGTVVAGRSARGEGAAFRRGGLYPESAARVVELGYQGETRKALVELAPIRWNRTTGELSFARRLSVELSFSGRETARRKRIEERAVARRLVTRERGLYGVSFEELFGRSRRGISADTLRLSRLGQTVAIHLEPDRTLFGRGSRLFFLSEGASANPYGDEAVYELELKSRGTKMPVVSTTPTGNPLSLAWQQEDREENRYYQAGLLESEDLWFWDLLFAPVTRSYSFELTALPSTSEPAGVSVWLQGVSDFDSSPDHHLRLRVNGTFLLESMLEGKGSLKMTAEIPAGVLREGENSLEIENVGDTEASYSMVMLDRFQVSYPRRLVPNAGRLEGTFRESGVAEVEGASDAFVLDTTEKDARWLGSGTRFRVEASRRYLVVSPEAVRTPGIRSVSSSGLMSPRNQADYLVVGPRAFLGIAQPLLDLRRGQGLRSKAIAIEDVYSEFGFGEERPEAVREFLSHAYHSWQKPSPRYVLLLGDGTYDFKDYLETGVKNRVPPFLVKTSYLWTA